MNPRTPMPSPSSRASRRGFIFLLVLLVLMIATIMIGVGIERAVAQSAIANLRLDEYKRHHEMLGVRDVVLDWFQRPGVRERMVEFAKDGGTAYTAVLPGDLAMSVRVFDGQGTVNPAVDPSMSGLAFVLNDIASRLPLNRPDLFRRFGPPQISLFGAPDEVLMAVAGNDLELAEVLYSMRDEPSMDAARFMTAMSSTGYAERSTELSQVLTFAPALYRIDTRVTDKDVVRRYTMLVEASGNLEPIVRGLKVLPGDGSEELLEEIKNATDQQPARRGAGTQDATPPGRDRGTRSGQSGVNRP